MAIDNLGRLYVGDNFGRVLAYPASLFNGSPATAVAGYTVNTTTQAITKNIVSPTGIFVTSDNRVGVVDGIYCRIQMLPSVDTWPSPSSKTQISPAAAAVLPVANTDTSSVQFSRYINAGNAARYDYAVEIDDFLSAPAATLRRAGKAQGIVGSNERDRP